VQFARHRESPRQARRNVHFETCRAGELFSASYRLPRNINVTELRAPASTDVRRIRVPRRGRLSDCRQRRLSHRSAFLFCNPDVTFTINLRCRGLLSTTPRHTADVHPRARDRGACAHAKGRVAGSPFTKKARARFDTLSEFNGFPPLPSPPRPLHLCLRLSD